MTARNPDGDLAPDAMTEYLTDDWGFFIRSAQLIEKFHSSFQDVEVHDSKPFGKLFRLDGHFMTSEKDEFFYHENLVHMAALSHPNPRHALIVGDRFFQFKPQGVTGTVLLAESHLAIHTWPEAGFVAVDVYVCNYTTDNSDKADRVFRALQAVLKPQRSRFQAIRRGGKDDGKES